MSEYQYYEFQAADRCLTEQEMRELRSFSTRAEITPYSFTNEYFWGSFKGDEDRWMEKYFDGFLYYANWGTHILKLRLPSTLLDLKTIDPYCHGTNLSARLNGDQVILNFVSENEDGDEWEEDLRLAPFLHLRADLSRGDLRCLYLGWLSGLQSSDCDEEELEPPVPPGLQTLSSTLVLLSDLLRIDPDILKAAADLSSTLVDRTPDFEDLWTWVCALSTEEKNNVLADILEGTLRGDRTAALKQTGRFNKTWQSEQTSNKERSKRRTVGELLRACKCLPTPTSLS
jgi:hypothetical protein